LVAEASWNTPATLKPTSGGLSHLEDRIVLRNLWKVWRCLLL